MAENETSDTAAADDAESEGNFASGFAGVEGKTDTKPPAKPAQPEPARDAAQAEVESAPEIISITKKEWDEIKAAASRTASYDSQFSKLFGTLGNVTKQLSTFQTKAAPEAASSPARKVEISKEAFAEMEKDFPELAQQTRAALEVALSGLPSPNGAEIDTTKIEGMWASYSARREVEALEDAWPNWREIVGAVDVSRETPNPENPFRKWLGTKDAAYQDRINGSESAAVIGRAIRLFQKETTVPAKPAAPPRNNAQTERIRAAVQPRGDNAGAGAAKTENEDFEEGYRGARG